MITKNFRNWLQLASNGGSSISNAMKNINGELLTSYFGSGTSNGFNYSRRKLSVGDNDTLPSKEDYTIHTTNLTQISTVTVPTGSGDSQTYEANTHGSYTSTTFTNNTAESIVIKEVGLICAIGSSTTQECLFAREVIEPVTIQPNETYTFTMKFE